MVGGNAQKAKMLDFNKKAMSIQSVEMTNDTEKDLKKTPKPELVKLDQAFKMAEQWVNNMSKSNTIKKPAEVELEGRQSRLGIGATVPRQSNFTSSNDPVQKKLMDKLRADKRKAERREEEPKPSAKDVDEDSEDELESKTRAFTKKRFQGSNSSIPAKKKLR